MRESVEKKIEILKRMKTYKVKKKKILASKKNK
jgi:hypothetical protein